MPFSYVVKHRDVIEMYLCISEMFGGNEIGFVHDHLFSTLRQGSYMYQQSKRSEKCSYLWFLLFLVDATRVIISELLKMQRACALLGVGSGWGGLEVKRQHHTWLL